MPISAMALRVISVLCQYGVLLCLFLFVYKLAKIIRRLLFQEEVKAETEKQAEQAFITVVKAEGQDSILQDKRFAFTGSLSVGRSKNNDIVLQDTFVSHHHIVIVMANGQYQIEDLHSANHTYLNGQVLNGRKVLHDGDLIQVGFAVFKFAR